LNGQNGGAGVSSSITGSAVTRAGGGGGAGRGGESAGSGGAGGGGDGSVAGNGVAGTANTGSGGGGGSTVGGNGGSGIVIFTLPSRNVVSFSAGVTQSSAVVGVNRVYTVTATSTTSETVTIA